MRMPCCKRMTGQSDVRSVLFTRSLEIGRTEGLLVRIVSFFGFPFGRPALVLVALVACLIYHLSTGTSILGER